VCTSGGPFASVKCVAHQLLLLRSTSLHHRRNALALSVGLAGASLARIVSVAGKIEPCRLLMPEVLGSIPTYDKIVLPLFSKRSEGRGDSSSVIKIPAAKSS